MGPFRMSGWVQRERSKQLASDDEKRQEKYRSFHTLLTQQLISDVAEINRTYSDHANWLPISVVPYEDYQMVDKRFFPTVHLSIKGGNRAITLTTLIKDIEGHVLRHTTDTLPVEWEGGRIILKANNQIFVIPEQASEFILMPIVESLKP